MSKNQKFIDKNIKRVGDFVDDHISKTENLKNGVPPFSSVEFSINGACNRRCFFCPRVNEEDYPNILQNLDMSAFKNLIKDLKSIDFNGRFSFTGFCEPLLTKNLDEYIFEISSNLKNSIIEIVSNGDVLITKKGDSMLKKLFEAGLTRIRVSLYDGPHQIKIFEDIQKKNSLTNDQFMIRKRYLGPDESYGITISNRAGSVKLQNEHFKLEALKEPLKKPCYYPFYKVLIDHDGAVLMCSNDWKKEKIYGNICNESLLDIWSNYEFNEIRKKLLSSDRNYDPCKLCDVNGTLNGEKSFQRWEEFFLEKN